VMRDMYRYHVVGRGFSDVGYNFAIDHRGTVYEGRWARHYAPGERHDGEDGGGFGVVGAHALGVNAGSCGIVLIGDFTKAKPTSAALASLIQLVSWKAALHQVDPLNTEEYISIFGLHRTFPNIAGHRQTGQTVCPGPLLFKQLPWIRDQVAARTGRFPAVTIDMSKALRWTDPSALPAGFEPSAEAVAAAATPAAPAGSKLTGYRILTSDGRVVTLGKAATLGSPRDVGLAAVSAIAGVPGRNAYLTAGSSGKVVGFGGAASGTPKSAVPTADVATTPSGQGYWVLSSSGGVYAFGSAKHYGSLSRSGVGSGGVKIRSTPSGKGYWILAANGRIYPFGDAAKLSGPTSGSVADFWPTPSGAGYWVLLADGRVGAYGDAAHFGDIPSLKTKWTKPAIAIVGMPSGRGYAIAVRDGGVFNFGSSPFLGSLAGSRRQIVGMALAFG
jgi:N-acetylmuramoyl-L-alanine amidase-like protein